LHVGSSVPSAHVLSVSYADTRAFFAVLPFNFQL
jgi:hypothetical protein